MSLINAEYMYRSYHIIKAEIQVCMEKDEDVKVRGIPTQADQWVNWQVTVIELENQIKSRLKKFCHNSTYFSSPVHFFSPNYKKKKNLQSGSEVQQTMAFRPNPACFLSKSHFVLIIHVHLFTYCQQQLSHCRAEWF